jgi:putative FmdB family regulatory protein
MPTYEYKCQKCHHRFEVFQSIKDAPKRSCPQCRGRVKRLLGTGAGLIFKGSGFYITDYRKPGYTEAAKKETPAATPAAAPKESSAPAAATAPKGKGKSKDSSSC